MINVEVQSYEEGDCGLTLVPPMRNGSGTNRPHFRKITHKLLQAKEKEGLVTMHTVSYSRVRNPDATNQIRDFEFLLSNALLAAQVHNSQPCEVYSCP